MAKISFQCIFKTMVVIAVILVFLQYFFFYPRGRSDHGHNLLYFDENNNAYRKESLFYFVKRTNSNSSKFPSASPWTDELETISPLVLSLDEAIAYGSGRHIEIKLANRSTVAVKNTNETIRFSHDLDNANLNLSLSSTVASKQLVSNSTVENIKYTELPTCPMPPATLIGFVRVQLVAPSLVEIGRMHPDLGFGGHYKPPHCKSKDRVAIILPFRDREEHLRTFLYNIHPFLKRQQIEYTIFVIEQGGSSADEPFNRGMLFNVGFREASKRSTFDCFIFHDVDLIPENDYNLYNCPQQPRHMSVAIDKMKYQLPYKTLFGGIAALRKEHYERVNGFSNMFWGKYLSQWKKFSRF